MPTDNISNGLEALLSWQFLLFSIGISILVFMLRTVIENWKPNVLNHDWYNKIVLPITPPFIGALISFIASNYAYPNGMTSVSDRLIFGLVAGAVSGLTYRILRSALAQKITQETTTVTTSTAIQYPSPTTNVVSEVLPPTTTTMPLPTPPLPVTRSTAK